MNDALEDDHPFAAIKAQPMGPTAPQVWMLGSSADSATYAAHFGLPFSFAHFINTQGGDRIMQAYRQHFRPSAYCPKPEGTIGVFALCAETREQADYLIKSRDLWLLRLMKGEWGPFPTPEEADAYPYSPHDYAIIEANRDRSVSGPPDQVKAELERLAELYGVEELVVVTISHDFNARVRSYELLAEAFALDQRAAA